MSENVDTERDEGAGQRGARAAKYRESMEAALARRSERLAYSIDELAVLAGCGRDKIYQAIRENKLDARKLGRRTLITVSAAREFLDDLPPLQLPPAASVAVPERATSSAALEARPTGAFGLGCLDNKGKRHHSCSAPKRKLGVSDK
jgi:excisionase family DNA binding protein